MVSILCSVVTDTLQRILNGAEERAPLTNNAGRRHAAGCFIAVYATLCDLEIALTDVVQVLNHFVIEHQTPIKVVVRWKLDTLLRYASDFGEKATVVHAFPQFASINPYLAGTEVRGWEKIPQRVVNLFPLACPIPILENSRASYFVEFPTTTPSTELLPRKSLGPSGSLSRDKEFIRSLIRRQILFQTIDIRERESIQRALLHAPQGVELLENMRREFADFIQHQFPLEEILT